MFFCKLNKDGFFKIHKIDLENLSVKIVDEKCCIMYKDVFVIVVQNKTLVACPSIIDTVVAIKSILKSYEGEIVSYDDLADIFNEDTFIED